MKVKNAHQLPRILYGLHFCPGVAEYREAGAEPYRIFLNEDTIRKMNPTFAGRPVYVQHVDEVKLEELHEADGYVVESFYNAADGKTWVKFIVVSDAGHEAIRNGWKLSNAYIPKGFGSGGLWNGVEYAKEVTSAEYEHLAIVPNPRYDESIILDAEQFKAYCADKQLELSRVANSKENEKGEKSVLNIFKKTKVENAADFDSMMVVLPQSKVELTLSECVAQLDKVHNMHGYANGDHLVKVGDKEMSVNEMCDAYGKMMQNEEDMKKKNAEEEEKKKNEEKKPEDDKKENEEKKEDEDKKKENETEIEKKVNALKNADQSPLRDPVRVDLDKTARGKARYGSN